jgi:hypothetical protein
MTSSSDADVGFASPGRNPTRFARRAALLALACAVTMQCSTPQTPQTQNGDPTDPDPDPDPEPTPDLVFSSAWNTQVGNSDQALSDGGRWNINFCYQSRPQVLTVVPGASVGWTGTSNVLRIQMRGATGCAQVQKERALPPSTSHWGRFYFRNDEVGNVNGHPVTYNCCGSIQIVPWSRSGSAAGVLIGPRPARDGTGTNLGYPYYGWFPAVAGQRGSTRLPNGTWFRYEWHIEYTSQRAYRIYPRIYNMAGELLYDFRNLFQMDYQGNGHSLKSWYDAGNTFGVNDPVLATHFGLGNEGPANSSATMGYWYVADVALSTKGWIGP